jgi:hypothetical protein
LAWKAESERCEPKKKLFFLKIVLCCELQKRAKVFIGVSFGAWQVWNRPSALPFFLLLLLRSKEVEHSLFGVTAFLGTWVFGSRS